MSKHTPGTWQAINWTYHSTSTVVVDDPSVVTGKRVIAECATEEDANLIAAAPKLLAASVNARDMLATERQAFFDCNAIHHLTTNLDQERIVVYGDGIWLDKDDAEVVGDYDRALAQLDAAIAQAT